MRLISFFLFARKCCLSFGWFSFLLLVYNRRRFLSSVRACVSLMTVLCQSLLFLATIQINIIHSIWLVFSFTSQSRRSNHQQRDDINFLFLLLQIFFPLQSSGNQRTMDTAGATSSSATPPNPYGGLEGPESMYLKLISSDGHEFVVRRDFAVSASPTIKNMLSGPGQYSESQPNEIYLKDIPSHVLINVCRYFAYKAKYTKYAHRLSLLLCATRETLLLLFSIVVHRLIYLNFQSTSKWYSNYSLRRIFSIVDLFLFFFYFVTHCTENARYLLSFPTKFIFKASTRSDLLVFAISRRATDAENRETLRGKACAHFLFLHSIEKRSWWIKLHIYTHT